MATSSKAIKEIGVSIKTTATKTKTPKKISELPPLAMLSSPLAAGNRQYIPEPQTEEQCRIYSSQVLIHVSISGKSYALSGPLADLDADSSNLREVFPSYHKCKPIGQARNPGIEITSTENLKAGDIIDLRFMNNGFRAFRATPTFKDPTDYLDWLNKVEKAKAQAWKDIGIYDLIMLSKLNLEYNTPMLISSLYFSESTHYTFHLPCGIAMPTLFDLAAITGLKPTGHTYDPDIDVMDIIAFSTTRATYLTHITHYHDNDTDIVFDVEHIAFLALWLSHSVFCSKSLQVAKKYLTLANQLHAGHNICLS